MKKSTLALALLGAIAGVAQAQTAVQIYGTVDAGITKQTNQTLNIGKRANNTLGFKGTEELGNGLKALFQLEIRYEPDTGTLESNVRPLFQGQSRVGLQGDFGMVRLGRGLTAFQESITAFEPWHGLPTPAGFQTDLQVAGYATAFGSGSDPLGAPSNSGNRFANAFFYNSPEFAGFQVNATIGTKENNGFTAANFPTPVTTPATAPRTIGAAPASVYALGAEASTNPFSISATYKNGPAALMVATERNAVETRLWSIAGAIYPVPELKVMASYQRQNQDHTKAIDPMTKAWVLGANYTMGPGKLLAGYGQKSPDGFTKTKQVSLGYEYSLSKRTYVYADASRRNGPVAPSKISTTLNIYSLGVNHAF